MRSVRRYWGGLRLLVTNIARTRRFHLLRFRLATFGLYEPHPWYGRRVFLHPWWQVNPRVARLLFRRLGAYGCWLVEMETIADGGQPGWWAQRVAQADYERLRAWINAENASSLAASGTDGVGRET